MRRGPLLAAASTYARKGTVVITLPLDLVELTDNGKALVPPDVFTVLWDAVTERACEDLGEGLVAVVGLQHDPQWNDGLGRDPEWEEVPAPYTMTDAVAAQQYRLRLAEEFFAGGWA